MALLLPTKRVQTQEMPCKLQRNLSSKLIFSVAQWRTRLIRTQRAHMFCSSIRFFFWVVLYHESVASTTEACICQKKFFLADAVLVHFCKRR